MVLKKETFSSLDMSTGPPIVLGDDSLIDSLGKGRIDLNHSKLNNVLYVLGIASNLLSLYQMTHTRSPKKVIFSPDNVQITAILNDKFIAKGVVDHTSKVYMFSHFLPYSNPLQEIFGMNYLAILTTSIFLI